MSFIVGRRRSAETYPGPGQNGGAGSRGGSNYVYRPAGPVDAPNVYTSFPALVAAKDAQIPGQPWTLVVDGGGALATAPAGTYDFRGTTIVQAALGDALEFADGTSLEVDILTIFGVVGSNNTASPLFTQSTSGESEIIVNGGYVYSNTSIPVFSATDGTLFFTDALEAVLGDGIHPVLSVSGAGTVTLYVLSNAGLSTGALVPVTSGTGLLYYDSSADIQSSTTGWVSTQVSQAVQTAYTPSVLANWSGTAPSSTANALDRIAAKIGPIP